MRYRGNLRLALRSLFKRPGFSIPVVLTLALGIGANTAIFSIVYTLLLKPLPFPDAERVVRVYDTQLEFKTAPAAHREYVDWRDQNRVFEEIGGAWPFRPTLTGVGEPEQLIGAGVTASFLRVFSAPPLAGRWFLDDEDRAGGPSVAILSEHLWIGRFGRAPEVIGRVVRLDGVPRTIVGVMPDSTFEGLYRLDVFVPLAKALDRQEGLHNMLVFARMKRGMALEQARSEMVALGRRLAGENRSNHGIDVVRYRDSLVGGMVAAPVLMLFGVVTFVLLIACANVANLLLARAASRRREIAIRVAMGAGRLRLAGLMLTESTVLALAGGLLGFALAWALVQALLSALSRAVPRQALAAIPSITVNWHVFVFTLGIAVATGLLFGLAPMVGQATRRVTDALKEDSGRSTGSRAARRLGSTLVVAEVALSVVLLAAAGLLVKSLVRLAAEPTGVVADRVLAFDVTLPPQHYAPEAVRSFYRRALSSLEALPGVDAVGTTTSLPMYNPNANTRIGIDGPTPWKPEEAPLTDMRWVGGDYFQALKIPLVRGRLLTGQDDERAPLVAVVSESLARKCWPGQDPIGKRVSMWGSWRVVVGVVGDVRSLGPAAAPAWEVDVPAAQEPGEARAINFALRTSVTDPLAVVAGVRREIGRIDPGLAVSNVQTMEDVVSRAVGPQRLLSGLVSAFAALAALLAVVGVYGLVAYTVAQRRWEFGVRMAMGADRGAILRLVLARGLRLGTAGVALGVVMAEGAARMISGLLHGVAPSDPWVLGGTCAAALLAALAAAYLPARSASTVDPSVTLRSL